MMPKMTGYELLERLRSDPKTRDIPVIVVSSRFLNESDLRLLERWPFAGESDREPNGRAPSDVHPQ
jgi:CheY-like chemotaxis protein